MTITDDGERSIFAAKLDQTMGRKPMNIVKELRDYAALPDAVTFPINSARMVMATAADEIERLRGLLGAAAKTAESKTFRDMKDKIMSGMAKDLGVDHG